MADIAAAPPDLAPTPTPRELFLGFLKVTISGFGGVLAWARREFVQERRWMTQDEFNELFALCQFLPGPNIVNFSIIYGSRIRGFAGAAAGLTGLLAPPVILMIVLGMLYSHFHAIPEFHGALGGLAAAAAGLLIATSVQMAEPLVRGGTVRGPLMAAAAFFAVGILQLPMVWVLLVLIPISIGLSWKALP